MPGALAIQALVSKPELVTELCVMVFVCPTAMVVLPPRHVLGRRLIGHLGLRIVIRHTVVSRRLVPVRRQCVMELNYVHRLGEPGPRVVVIQVVVSPVHRPINFRPMAEPRTNILPTAVQ